MLSRRSRVSRAGASGPRGRRFESCQPDSNEAEEAFLTDSANSQRTHRDRQFLAVTGACLSRPFPHSLDHSVKAGKGSSRSSRSSEVLKTKGLAGTDLLSMRSSGIVRG